MILVHPNVLYGAMWAQGTPSHPHIHTPLIHAGKRMETHAHLPLSTHTTPSTIFIEKAKVLSKIVLSDTGTQTSNYFDYIQTPNFRYLLDNKETQLPSDRWTGELKTYFVMRN